MGSKLKLITIFILICSASLSYAVSSYTFDADVDTQIYEKQPSFDYSNHTTFVVGSFLDGGVNFDVQGLLKFDVSSIAPGQTATDAFIQLHITNRTSTAGTLSVEAFKIGSSWNTSTVTYPDRLTLPEGADIISYLSYSTNGGSTWQDIFKNNPVYGLPDTPSTYEVRIYLNVDGLSLIDSWISDSSQNYGILLKSPFNNSVTNYARFSALEGGSGYATLHLTTEDVSGPAVPEPATIILSLISAVSLFIKRRIN
ncbi:MAG: DNRLRE domain-containing protein [Candidatus Auribacterota bacterium]|jgi:hypothetical protein|nr:DNRLRE domain-containing protein [Candidatus Auribacterota bacterium]